ncbi:MetQ/NlpA family ABC transporter substrate-binding protein [Orenia marismortui]|uniref:Lipoprotein n=1 Tax=Orenia marismortui TaxID=46469 RepID=A0A4R8GSL1_9FIRM|nr:MetQ/NlpA family ABC transporter substrate-binding protein [Orenia marismortui]TDX48902.1 D-methionine transport system substrate-binding protein [Orenia marismortui]
MRKSLNIITVLLIAVIVLTACGKKEASIEKKIVIGVTPVPHTAILNNVVKPILAKEGIIIEIKEFTDYVTPNLALADGSIDANYFQHIPYLNNFKEKRGLDLTEVTKVHIPPTALYSDKIDSLDKLSKGDLVAIPNDATNEGRALLLLERAGLIKLAEDVELVATPADIVDNPKKLEFKELEAAQLPRILQDVDAAVITANYAIEAGLKPAEDAIIKEDATSPYANVLAVRTEDKDNPTIKKLAEALNSQEVKEFIIEKYQGNIIPAF